MSNHIFLFILDAVRKDHLSLYGYPRKTSPNIDKLAKQADVYQWAFAPSSYTLASVPSILAGKYPTELSNLFTGGEFSEEDFENLLALKKKGYKLAMFTANIVTSHYHTNIYKYFEYFWDNLTEQELNRKDFLYQKAEVLMKEVKNFVLKNKKEKLFVVIHLMEAHGPYTPWIESKFKNDEIYKKEKRIIDRVVNDVFKGVSWEMLKKYKVCPRYQLLNLKEGPNGEIEDFNSYIRDYISKYDMGIYLMDKELGQFFKFLQKIKLFDSAKIIITADHGELLGEENIFFSHGIFTSPELINILLIIKNPFQTKHKLLEENFSLINILNENKNYLTLSLHPKSISIIEKDDFFMIHLNNPDVIDDQFHLFPTDQIKDSISVTSQTLVNFFYWKKMKTSFRLLKRGLNIKIENKMVDKIQKIQNKRLKKLEFTGERLIPKLNKGQAFFYEHLARYLFACQFAKNKVVLDAGCWVGYGCYIISKYGKAKKVFGVDISKETIASAKENYKLDTIDFNVDDVEKLQTVTNKSIDLVVSFEVIEHLKNQEKFLNQVKRVLKENGMFIVSTPNKFTYPPGNPFHTKELYPEEFYQLLKQYFKNVKFYHQSFELAQLIKEEGKEIFNLEETFQILAQKVYTSPLNKKTSQYLLTICSDKTLPKAKTLSLTSTKVDNFDLSQGLLSLGAQFTNLQTQLTTLTSQNTQLNQQLSQKNQEIESYKNQIKELEIKLMKIEEEKRKTEELEKENQAIRTQIEQTRLHIQNLETQLNTIKSAKFFKLWQGYCKIMKLLKLKS